VGWVPPPEDRPPETGLVPKRGRKTAQSHALKQRGRKPEQPTSQAKNMVQQSVLGRVSLEQGISILFSYMFSGAVGPTTEKGVSYSFLSETESCFSFIAALEDEEKTGEPIHRYHIIIDRMSGKVRPPQLISLSNSRPSGCYCQSNRTSLSDIYEVHR
jgi:hypothetical protein